MDFKDIHIGSLIRQLVAERGIEISRICNFLEKNADDIEEMYEEESADTGVLLRWSKLLEYDFFRVYTQHLILFSPPAGENHRISQNITSALPQFRKNIYTKEIIEFILEQINTGEMSKNQVMEQYKIPKTTLYKWISKYNHPE